MMDSSALKHLEQSHKTGTIVADGHAVIIGDDFKISDLEKYAEQRARFRGRYATSSIADFVSYVGDRAAEKLPIFIDRDEMRAVCYLDMGDQTAPGHCEHAAKLSLDKTAEFKAYLGADGRSLDQDGMVELIEDWGHLMQFQNSEGEALEPRKVLHAIRKVSIEDLTSMESERQAHSSQTGVMNTVTVKNADRLPAVITWSFVPFAELSGVTLDMRVSALTNGKPGFRLRAISLEAETSRMAEEFAARVRDELPQQQAMQGSFTP